MMLMSTSRRGLTHRLTDFGSFSGFVGLGREVLAVDGTDDAVAAAAEAVPLSRELDAVDLTTGLTVLSVAGWRPEPSTRLGRRSRRRRCRPRCWPGRRSPSCVRRRTACAGRNAVEKR
jgi:hypothetical protein